MPSRRRTALLGTLLIGTLLLAAVALPASATSARGSDPTPAPSITLSGRGHGHGVGLSQDGALALGRAGASLTQMLGTFYPGTSLVPVGHADVRVAVASAKQHDAVRVLLAAGGVVRSGSSGVQVPPGGSVDLRHEADGYQVALVGAPAKAARSHSRSGSPYSITSAAPVQVVATGRVYRGTLQLVAVGPDLRVVDTVDVESYLLGLGEVRDPSWPLASLQAQVVAARTYALHARTAGNPVFDVWDDDRSQVYLGVGGEYDALARAVRTTRGEVLAFGGALINAFYSSSGGGCLGHAGGGLRAGGCDERGLLSARGSLSDRRPAALAGDVGADGAGAHAALPRRGDRPGRLVAGAERAGTHGARLGERGRSCAHGRRRATAAGAALHPLHRGGRRDGRDRIGRCRGCRRRGCPRGRGC